jgi:hypothetical protein
VVDGPSTTFNALTRKIDNFPLVFRGRHLKATDSRLEIRPKPKAPRSVRIRQSLLAFKCKLDRSRSIRFVVVSIIVVTNFDETEIDYGCILWAPQHAVRHGLVWSVTPNASHRTRHHRNPTSLCLEDVSKRIRLYGRRKCRCGYETDCLHMGNVFFGQTGVLNFP